MPVDISEYPSLSRDGLGSQVPTGAEPAAVFQQVTASGASAQSAPFGEGTRFVRVHTDAAVRIAIGPNPTASAATMRLGANSTEFFGVRPGHKLAAISSS